MRIVLAVFLLATATTPQTPSERTTTLDAAEKHIVQSPYHASEAVTLGGKGAGGWHVYAGAAIDARQIDLRMRNVRGQVRYRADATQLQNALRRWR